MIIDVILIIFCMHLLKTFNLSIFIALFSLTSFFSSPNLVFGQAPQGGTLVATVNLSDATITSQQDNIINGVFTISNREGVQSGVRYGVQLLSTVGKSTVVVDEIVFDESLYLAENSSQRKSFSYTAPSTLSGSYTLLLVSKNSANFPFAFYPLGTVKLTASTKGVMIATQSCTVKLDNSGKTYPLTQAIMLGSAVQAVDITCSATNTSATSVSTIPSVSTTESSAYGEVIQTPSVATAPIVFKAGEKKTFTLSLPLASKPQTYFAQLTLLSGGISSNSINVTYTIPGVTATISNLSLDKDFYTRGETAALSLVWLSSLPKVTLSATLTNGSGLRCAKPIEQDLLAGTSEVLFPVTSTCRDPKVIVELKNSTWGTLDQKEFSAQTPKSQKGGDVMPFVVLIVLAALIIIWMFIKRHKKAVIGDNTPPNTPSIPMRALLPIIMLGGLGALIPFQSVSADTISYNSGPGNVITTIVTVSPVIYAPNEPLWITWNIYNTGAVAIPVSFRATNNISPITPNPATIELMTPVTLPAGLSTGDQFATSSFFAPSPSGTYAIEFETGVDLPATEPILVRVRSEITAGPQSLACTLPNGGGQGTYLDGPTVTSYIADFYASMSDYNNNIPLDVTGRNLRINRTYYSSQVTIGLIGTFGQNIPLTTALSPVLSGTSDYIYGSALPGAGLWTYIDIPGQFVPEDCETFTHNPAGEMTVLDGSGQTVPYAIIPDFAPTVSLTGQSGGYTGDSIPLNWNVAGADSCIATNFTLGASSGTFSGSDSLQVNGNITYSLSCTNLVGTTIRSLAVEDWGPEPPPDTCLEWPGITVQCAQPANCVPNPMYSGYGICEY